MELRFEKNPPAARPAAATVIRRSQLAAEHGRRDRMTRSRPKQNDELAADDFTDDVLRQREQVVVGGWPRARSGLTHGPEDSTASWTKRAKGRSTGGVNGCRMRPRDERHVGVRCG